MSKCVNCDTKLGKIFGLQDLTGKGTEAFCIFTAPAAQMASEAEEEAVDTTDGARVLYSETGPDDEVLDPVEEKSDGDFVLDLSDTTPEGGIAPFSEESVGEASLPVTEDLEQEAGVPETAVLDFDNPEQASELEVEGLGFEPSEEVAKPDSVAVEESGESELQSGLEATEVAVEPENPVEEEAPEVELDFEPELEMKEAEAVAEPENSAVEIEGDVEFNFDPEEEASAAEKQDGPDTGSSSEKRPEIELDLDSDIEIELDPQE
ncbi:MAG: hypothetical protein VYC17_02730 [Nitrospinota bacterium]|nr:hypothetical protein [Nitrospinota bacterium]